MSIAPQEWRARLRQSAITAALVCAFACARSLGADCVLLNGGERLIGRIVSEDERFVVFESHALGKLEVARSQVERIERSASISPPPINSSVCVGQAHAPLFPSFHWPTAAPDANSGDWVQLKSGEWLKGRLKSLQDERLEFDSEELDVHSFDWKDIRMVHSSRPLSMRLDGQKPIDGSLLVTSNEVHISDGTATNIFTRADLLAIAPTGSREVDLWSGKISAGVSFRGGNTRETEVNTHASFERRTPLTGMGLDYLGNYGKVNGVETEENHRFTSQFDYFLSRRLYVRLPDLEYFRDPLQNIEHRLTLGGGAGYDLVKTARTEWGVTLGPAWQANWFGSVPQGDPSWASSAALVLATKLDVELTERVDFLAEYRGQLTSRETGNDTHHAITTLEFELKERLKLDLSFVWDRITSPKTEADGATPIPDDFRLITSLVVDF